MSDNTKDGPTAAAHPAGNDTAATADTTTGGAGHIPYTVVVGCSASSGSPAALRWAHDQAKAAGGWLIIVRAWKLGSSQATPAPMSAGRIPVASETEAEQHKKLMADVEDVLGADHGAEVRLVRGGKRKVLLEAAGDADLLVVDAPRGPGQRPTFVQRLLYEATCPVVVMPPTISGEPESTIAKVGRVIGERALRAAGTAGRPGYRTPLPSD